MKKPVIKDKKIAKYVEYLEEKLASYTANNPIAKMYLGLRKQVDDMGTLLMSDIEIELENGKKETVPLMDAKSLTSKDDKFFDRIEKIFDKSLKYAENLEELEKKITPEEIDKMQEAGSLYEQALRDE